MPRRAFCRALAIAGVILWVIGAASPLNAADPRFQRPADDPIARARAQRSDLASRIVDQRNLLAGLTASSQRLALRLQQTSRSLGDTMVDLATARADLTSAQMDLAATEVRRDGLQTQVNSLDWGLDVMAGQADELAADLAQRRRELGARLADAYRASQTGLWEQVIAAGSFLDALIQQQGALSFGQRDLELAQSIERDQALLDRQRRELQSMRYDTQQLHDEVAASAVQIAGQRDALIADEQRLADLEARTAQLQAAQAAQYASLLDDRQAAQAALARQQQAATRLTARIKALLEKERHAGKLPSVFNGTFRWPLIGEISQEFGCTGFALEPPEGNCPHFHQGIDIVAPYGAPVVAAGDGIVLVAGWDPGAPRKDAAFCVIIAHSDHLVSVYAHFLPRLPKGIFVGAHVREGQVIGWEGNTGNSTGAHLHWSVRLDGVPVNPRYFL